MFDFKSLNVSATPNTHDSTPRRTKGNLSDLCDGQPRHIESGFRLRTNDYGPYATFYVTEDPNHFYYSGKRITKVLQQIDAAGARDYLPEQAVIFKKENATFEDGRSVQFFDVEF